MYKNRKIGVVVPAYNEEKFIGAVIDSVPVYVDKIYVVNDASIDNTLSIMKNQALRNTRVVVVNRKERGGVGAAILSGHIRALQEGMDISAVMAGDGQMVPDILESFLDPLVEDKADYVKGDRLSNSKHRKEMPTWRTFGNIILTNLTRVASGYWHISDPQDGYTAISTKILRRIDLHRIEKGFAFENDMLVKLNVAGARVVDVQHPAVYRGQKSKINYTKFILSTSWVLLKDFAWRICTKYVKRDSITHEIKKGYS